MRGQRHAPAALFPGKEPVTIVQEAGWAPGPVWTGAENLAPPGFDPRTVQPVDQSLYRLSYPATIHHSDTCKTTSYLSTQQSAERITKLCNQPVPCSRVLKKLIVSQRVKRSNVFVKDSLPCTIVHVDPPLHNVLGQWNPFHKQPVYLQFILIISYTYAPVSKLSLLCKILF
jgi:hypothetical protein